MPFTHIPRRLTIEMVRAATVLINSIPRKGGVHDAMSARELITGKKLQIPLCRVGEFVIAHNYTSSDVEKPRGFDALYLRPNDNGSGHFVFNIATKRVVLVPRCTPAPMTDTTIATVNAAGKAEKQPEGISFADLDGTVRLEDYDFSDEQHEVIQNEEMDDNASDKSYEDSEEEDSEDDLSFFSAESHYDPAR